MTSDSPLIGVTGFARHGKDTFAAALVDRGWTKVAFGDPLREMALRLDPVVVAPGGVFWARLSTVINQHGWEGAKGTPFSEDVRRTLQRLGTDAIRGADEDFWTRIFTRRVTETAAPVVAPDVRFPDEARTIRDLGGIIVRVRRPDAPVSLSHASEASVATIYPDVEITNDQDRDTLQERALWVAARLGA